MKNLALLLVILSLSIVQATASLTTYEAGNAVICIDDKLEKNDLGNMFDIYPTRYFEPVTSREEVKNNEYTLVISKVTIVSPGDLGMIEKPIRVMISDNPFDLNATFSFLPSPVKTVKIGRLGQINTTLYSGSWSEQTPHLVAFTKGDFSCCIYGQDIDQDEIEDFLKRIDVVNKSDLATYLPLLWTE
jgi:hypothetical protein